MHLIWTIPLLTFVLLTTAFWLWMLRDCLYNTSLSVVQKVLWFLLIFFTHLLGAIAYFIIGRSKNQPSQGAPVQESQPH